MADSLITAAIGFASGFSLWFVQHNLLRRRQLAEHIKVRADILRSLVDLQRAIDQLGDSDNKRNAEVLFEQYFYELMLLERSGGFASKALVRLDRFSRTHPVWGSADTAGKLVATAFSMGILGVGVLIVGMFATQLHAAVLFSSFAIAAYMLWRLFDSLWTQFLVEKYTREQMDKVFANYEGEQE